MRFIFIAILFSLTSTLHAQNFFTSIFLGGSNYQGDLQDKALAFTRFRPAWGVGLLFELNTHFLLTGDFTSGKISADDKFSLKNKARNLSFNSNITEFSIGLEYVPVDLYQYKISPYVFSGLAIFKFSPYINADNGSKIILYEFDTEGQGFYKGRKKYKLTQFAIPLGAGIQWALTDNKRIGLVFGIRKTFTDYLDDVSTTYIDKDILAQKKGTNAVKIAYRGNLLPNGEPYPPDGTKRGNPENKDWYYFAGLSLRFRIGPSVKKSTPTFRIKRAKVTCPTIF